MTNNVSIPYDLLAQAEQLAARQGRTADDLAAEALKRYIETERKLRDLSDLASWGEHHSRERGFEPSDVDRAISEMRHGR